MRGQLGSVVLAALLAGACTGPGPGLTGNDTGGIIVWSPENEVVARSWAADHCAHYNKYARMTSIHRQYGNYIGFKCVWSPRALP